MLWDQPGVAKLAATHAGAGTHVCNCSCNAVATAVATQTVAVNVEHKSNIADALRNMQSVSDGKLKNAIVCTLPLAFESKADLLCPLPSKVRQICWIRFFRRILTLVHLESP